VGAALCCVLLAPLVAWVVACCSLTARTHPAPLRPAQPPSTPLPKQVTEKAEHLRKGASAAEASKRIAPSVKVLQDARVEWVAAGVALCE
jgi:hypothetical protein